MGSAEQGDVGLSVDVTFAGLTREEMQAVLGAMPVEASALVERKKVVIGGPRYEVSLTGCSVAAVRSMSDAITELATSYAAADRAEREEIARRRGDALVSDLASARANPGQRINVVVDRHGRIRNVQHTGEEPADVPNSRWALPLFLLRRLTGGSVHWATPPGPNAGMALGDLITADPVDL